MEALGAAVSLAEACQATLVALAFLRVKGTRRRPHPRLEHLMEANDFLEAVRWKAARAGVSTEGFQVETADVGQSLDVLARQFSCSGIVLFAREGQGVLLSTEDIVGYFGQGNCPCYLLQMKAKPHRSPGSLLKRLFSFFFRQRRRTDGGAPDPALAPVIDAEHSPGDEENLKEEALGHSEDGTQEERTEDHG